MELINQHTKKIMEECKVRARDAGLSFDDESLEYIVTNRDMLELSPKVMIPTLYDYWVNDVEVLKGKGKYKLYPNNPYETVINTRPAISFYNDNNPDWLNIMIFYHVLGHIDFFQNNLLFQNTWSDDFAGSALADKRYLENLRKEHGRWVDYAIEFSRCIDNMVGYFGGLFKSNFPEEMKIPSKIEYYLSEFLQNTVDVSENFIYREIDRYNAGRKQNPNQSENTYFSDVRNKFPEFQAKYEKHLERKAKDHSSGDLMEFIRDNSPFLAKNDNNWIKSVMNIVRDTGLYFGPQIRTKTVNEGWASYWHDFLFRNDSRIAGHESAYAKTNAAVTSVSRVGLNPYAIGLRLIQHIENNANKGKSKFKFQQETNAEIRNNYDSNTGKGRETIFELRKNFSDFMLFNTYVDQDFVDTYDLFVVGKRFDPQRGVWQYYVKSRKAEDYKNMLMDSLYHPPYIKPDLNKTTDAVLYLNHVFEGKQLYSPYISDTMLGIDYLWSGLSGKSKIELETTEIIARKPKNETDKPVYDYKRVVYTMENKKLSKRNL